MTDIDIARDCKMLEIDKISKKLNIDEKYLECFGKYKAKINLDILNELDKKRW